MATIAGPSGISRNLLPHHGDKGLPPSMAWVAKRGRTPRSTARAPRQAQRIVPRRPSAESRTGASPPKRPAALSMRLALRELEQISSAKSPL